MKKKLIALTGLLVAFVSLSAGLSYSWYMQDENLGPGIINTPAINTAIYFSLNGNKGIPGETVVISGDSQSTENRIAKASADYIFKLTYTVTFEEGEPDAVYITDLALAEANANALGLIKAGDYMPESRTVTYYGKHTATGDLELGELLATFAKLKNPAMNKEFIVKAEIDACQITKKAVEDIFGIDSTTDGGKYAALFNNMEV